MPMLCLDVLHGRAMCIAQLTTAPGRTLTMVNAVGVPAGGHPPKQGEPPRDARAAVRMSQAAQLGLAVRSLTGEVIVAGRLFHGGYGSFRRDGQPNLQFFHANNAHSMESSLVSGLSGLQHVGSSGDTRLAVYAPHGGTTADNVDVPDVLRADITGDSKAAEPCNDVLLRDVRDVIVNGTR